MSTPRGVFRHAAVYSTAAILAKAVGFIMLPVYAHILGSTGYGVIGMVDATLTLLMSLFGYSITGSIIRLFHEEPEGGKPVVVSTALWLLWGGGGAVVALCMLLSPVLSNILLGRSDFRIFFILALASFFFDLTGKAAQTILVIEQRSVSFSVLGLLRLVTALSLNIYLILILRLDLLGYFLSSIITAALFSFIFHAISIRKCGMRFDRDIARRILRFELPMVPGNLLGFISRQIERVLVRFFVSLEGVGVLEIGYKFPTLISLFVTQPFMLSWNTKRTEIAEQSDAPGMIGRMFTYFVFLSVLVGLALAVNLRLVIEILTPPDLWYAYRIGRIEVITQILLGCYYHLHFGLFYHKRTKTMSIIRGATSVLKVGASALFIWLWGIFGAAYSACVIAAIQLLWAFRLSQRLYRLKLEYGKIAIILTVAAIFYGLGAELRIFEGAAHGLWGSTVAAGWVDGLRDTALGGWKDGKAVELFSAKGGRVYEVAMNTGFVASFCLVLPLIRESTRSRLLKRIRRLSG